MPVLIISDTHIGSTLAVCPPAINKDDGDTHYASSWQLQLWEGWNQMAALVKHRIGERPLTLILNGDLAEFDTKNRTTQVVTRNESTILSLVVNTLEPFTEIASKIYVVRGTEAHVGSFEEKIADDLDAVKDPDRDTYSFWHLRRIFDGRKFDITHHIAGNTENAVINLGRRVIMSASRRGEPLPDYVIRSHVHRAWDTGKTFGSMRVMTTPCFVGPNSYTFRIGAENEHPQIGMLYFDGGLAEPEYLTMAIKPRAWTEG